VAAYLASLRNLVEMESLRKVPGAVELVRDALLEESGKALCRKWSGKDPLFTEEGFAAHASDLLERIFNPYLGDLVERVARDAERKLGWDDRLVGAMRLALSMDVLPRRLALGTAAALLHHEPRLREEAAPAEEVLEEIWRPSSPDLIEKVKVLELVREALPRLRRWLRDGSALTSF
jgi:mannitol-1-phosphate 5-dehydrogenase